MLSLKKESKLLAKHSLIYGVGNMLNGIIAFLLLPVYTRYLSPTDYGIKELVGLSADVISILLATSVASAIYRFYFVYKDEKDRNEVISSAILIIGIIGLLAIFGLFFSTKIMAFYILDDATLYHYFSLSFIAMWFQALNDIGYNYLKANQKSLVFISISIIKLLIALSLNIYFIISLGYGVLGIFISNVITAAFITIILVIPILKRTGLRFSAVKVKEMVKFGLPLIPSQLGAFMVHLSDRFFIKAFVSIPDAGLYSLGYRFGALPGTFVSSPFNQIWQPRRFELYKQKGSEVVFGRIFTYFLGLMVFVSVGITVLTQDVLKLIADPQYWEAYQIVGLIALASVIFSLHYHFNFGILIKKKTKYLAYINLSNGLLILVLNYFLIKHYGIWGAAYATIIAFIYKVSLTYYFSSKYYKIHFEGTRIAKLLIAGVLIYIPSQLIELSSISASIILKILILLLYPLLLWLFAFPSSMEKEKLVELLKYRLSKKQ